MTNKLEALIKKYNIVISPKDQNKLLLDPKLPRCSQSEINADVAFIKEHKAELLAILQERS